MVNDSLYTLNEINKMNNSSYTLNEINTTYDDMLYTTNEINKTGEIDAYMNYFAVEDSMNMFYERITRADLWYIYIIIGLIILATIISCWYGINSEWYLNLKKNSIHRAPVLIGALWIISTAISFVAIFMLWEHIKSDDYTPFDIKVSAIFIIGNFLTLLWAIAFFQINSVKLALLVGVIIFLFYFGFMIYVARVRLRAAIFLIPVIILYAYLVYSMIHIATLNNIII